jgi:DNA-binding PadR family transcriptional regulator
VQPATAYQLSKIYAQSPVSNFGISKGKIYPLIRRLRDDGLVDTRAVPGDARGSELLECTRAGKQALRAWVRQIRPGHLLLKDPLRTMVQSFPLLTKEEQVEWIGEARRALQEKLREVDEYAASVSVPYMEAVHDNAASSLKCRLAWLDRLETMVAKGGEESRPARGAAQRNR